MSRRERQRRRRRHQSGRVRRTILFILGLIVAGAVLAVLTMVGYVVSVASSAPSISELAPSDKGAVSEIFAADGTRLGFIQNRELRTPLEGRGIPREVREATVAIEDRRFYRHRGVDYEGVIRAAMKNITSGETIQGGSTITMQLVRNLYIGKERTFERKVREAKLAEELENEHSKDWILTTYLNTVPYGTVGGQEVVGIGAAARAFFNKQARSLRLHEAALLAGLPQAPSSYDPFTQPERAKRRRDDVLEAMAGQQLISRPAADAAKARDLEIRPNRYFQRRRENFFFDYVKTELAKRYGAKAVAKGGLKIHTTIDLDLQKRARAAIAGRLNQPGDPASAVVAVDPSNGFIRAMASSARYEKSKFNLATQGKRQPGSTFKVMVLMAALRRGMDPDRTFYVSKPIDIKDETYGPIKVKTYDNSYGGGMNITRATLRSDNAVYIQMDLDVGPDAVKETARDMGIVSPLQGYPAEGLGGLKYGVSPLEMANSFATVASGGYRSRPVAITRVEFPTGRVEKLGEPRRTKVFENGITDKAVKILRQNVTSGTGRAASGVPCTPAGKTGTTDNFNDAWFVGFTPRLATAVWVGHPNAQVEMRNVHGISVAGGTFPTQIWADFMADAVDPKDCGEYPQVTEPARFSPFFGKYAATGTRAATTGTTDGEDQEDADGKDPGKAKRTPARDYENPDIYESPPDTGGSSPPGNGNGNGNGGGNGNGNGNGGGSEPPPD